MTNTARRWGVAALIFAAGMASAAYGLVELHQFSPHNLYALMRPDRVVYLYHYTLAHYKINYFEYGFVKRALLSNVFVLFHGQAWVDATLVFNLVFDMALAALVALFLSRLWCERPWHTAAAFSVVTLFGSLGVINMGSDLGRFDFALLVMLIGSMALVARGAVLGPALITGAALLTHEIYFFFGVPLLLLYTLDRMIDAGECTPRTIARRLWPMLAVVVVTGLALKYYGRYEPGFDALSHRFGRFVFPAAVAVWTRPITGNLTLVSHYWTHGIYTVLDIGCEAFIWLVITALAGLLYGKRQGSALLLFAPLCVLPLYALGTDYARWCKLGFALLFTAIAFANRDRRLPGEALDGPWVVLLVMCLLGLPLMPFGIEHAFQYLMQR